MKKYEEAQITIISFDQSDDIITTSGNPITTDYDEDTNFGAIDPNVVLETNQF